MVDLLRFLLPGGETTGAAAAAVAADPAAGDLAFLLVLLVSPPAGPPPGLRPPGFHMTGGAVACGGCGGGSVCGECVWVDNECTRLFWLVISNLPPLAPFSFFPEPKYTQLFTQR